MSFDQNEEQSVSQRVRNDDMKYELQVITLLAARLANNLNVEDYWIITNPENVCSFDDIIAIIKYKSGEKHVLMLQVMHSEKRMRLITHDPRSWSGAFKKAKKKMDFEGKKMEYLEIPLYKYLVAYNEIKQKDLKNKKLLEHLKDIPFENYFFGIFTTMGKEVQVETEKEIFTTGQLELSPGNTLSFLSTNDLTSKMPLISTLPTYNELLLKLYFFIEQPNSTNIYKELQLNIPSFTNHMVDNLCDIIEKCMNKRINDKMECFPLTKKMFFESSLELSLSQTLSSSINNCKNLKPMMDDTFNTWQSIFKEHNVTIINDTDINKIMLPLYSFYQQQIHNEYDLHDHFSWERCVKNCFQLNKTTIEKTRNSKFTSTNLRDLLIYMWKENKIPLIVDNTIKYWFKTSINTFSGCDRQYILIVNEDEEIEIPNNMTIFGSMVDVNEESYFEDIMDLKVSFQGRSAESLKDIIDISLNILEVITPCDILEWTYNADQPITLGKELKRTDVLYIGRQFSAFNQIMDEKEFIQHLKPGTLTAISNEPGMGKSTVISSLASLCKPTNYVLTYNLAKCVNDLESNDSKIHLDPIQYFFEKTEGAPNNLLQKIFKYHESTKRLILFLDSFDEISPVYSEKVLNILQKMSNITVIVATRSQAVSQLQNRFKKINVVELKHLNEKHIATYCYKRGISKNIYNNMSVDFLTVPLHLSMLASTCANFEVDATNMSLSNFYEQFIEAKIDIYSRKININIGNNKLRMKSEKIINGHMKIALVYIFGIDTMEKLQIITRQKWDKILQQFKDYKMSLGILSSMDTEKETDIICFVHKSFAEYFVARWLFENSPSAAKQNIYDMVVNNKQYVEIMKFLCDIKVSCIQNLFKNDMRNDITKIKLSLAAPDQYNMILLQWATMNLYYHANNDFQKNSRVNILEHVLLCSGIMIKNNAQMENLGRYFKSDCIYCKNAVDTAHQCGRKFIGEFSEFFKNLDLNQELNLLLVNYINILLKFKTNRYILDIACLLGNPLIIKFLLDLTNTDVNARMDCGDTPLYISCFHGNRDVVETLLNYKAHPTIVNKKGQTCLHIACIKENLDIARLLLQANTDPSIQDVNGHNCIDVSNFKHDSNALGLLLHDALLKRNLTVINFLLNYKVNPNVKGNEGLTCIQLARQLGNSEIFLTLLLGEFPFLSDTNHKNCLNARKIEEYENNLELLLYDLFLINDMKLVRYLLEHVEPNVTDTNECSVLYTACLKGNVELVLELLNYNATPQVENNNGENSLHAASRGNNLDVFKLILEKGVDPKLKNKHGSTCLHLACESGSLQIVQTLIELNLDPNDLNFDEENCLHVACMGSSVNIVKLLLNHSFKANLKQRNKYGYTYLHLGCRYGSTEIVQTLIEAKLDPNELNLNEENCLHAACKGSNMKTVKLLLNHIFNKGNLKQQSKYGHTYLHLACQFGSTEIVQTLIESKLDPNELNLNEENCLHAACRGSNTSTVKLLLNHTFRMNLNQKNRYGCTYLYVACQYGSTDIVQTLIESKLDPNELNLNEENCLHGACRGSNINTVKLLLNHRFKINLNQKNRYGCTYPYIACQFGSTEIVQTLIESKLDPNVLNVNGENCLHAACRGTNVNTVRLLLNHSFKINLKQKNRYGCTYLYIACQSGSTEIVQTLVNSKLDPNVLNSNEENCLHAACRGSNANTVKLLLNHSFKINLKQKNKQGWTYLHLACVSGNLEIVQTLIESKLDPSELTFDKENCLHIACRLNNIDVVKCLLQEGVDPNVPSNHGYTCFHLACKHGYLHTVETLLKFNADPNILNNFKESSLEIAYKQGNGDIINLLLTKMRDSENWPKRYKK